MRGLELVGLGALLAVASIGLLGSLAVVEIPGLLHGSLAVLGIGAVTTRAVLMLDEGFRYADLQHRRLCRAISVFDALSASLGQAGYEQGAIAWRKACHAFDVLEPLEAEWS